MKKALLAAVSSLSLLLLTQAASAHPGHDHTGIPGGFFHQISPGEAFLAAALAAGIFLSFSKQKKLARVALGVSFILAGLLLAGAA